jgi:hypothetical protein
LKKRRKGVPRIILVNNDQDVRKAIGQRLFTRGFKVRTIFGEKKRHILTETTLALYQADINRRLIVVSDFMLLSNLDGPELLRLARRIAVYRGLDLNCGITSDHVAENRLHCSYPMIPKGHGLEYIFESILRLSA